MAVVRLTCSGFNFLTNRHFVVQSGIRTVTELVDFYKMSVLYGMTQGCVTPLGVIWVHINPLMDLRICNRDAHCWPTPPGTSILGSAISVPPEPPTSATEDTSYDRRCICSIQRLKILCELQKWKWHKYFDMLMNLGRCMKRWRTEWAKIQNRKLLSSFKNK